MSGTGAGSGAGATARASVSALGVALLFLVLLAGGCGWLSGAADRALPDRRPDYREAREARKLELPPDLSRLPSDEAVGLPGPSGSATYSEYAGRRGRGPAELLPQPAGVRVLREGDRRWLVVEAEPGEVWKRVREFLASRGYPVRREDPALGIVETDWVETRIDVPQGVMRRLFGKLFGGGSYAAAVRDRFRIRIERGERPGTTEVFVTHFGVEEVYAGNPELDFDSAWQLRPRDPELEAELLTRLMLFLGVDRERARRMIARAEGREPVAALGTDGEGRPVIRVRAGFPQAWRLMGIALDRAGFTVLDRDRSAGVYFVRYADPHGGEGKGDEARRRRGFLSRLAFWRRDERAPEAVTYQIRITGAQEHSVVRVADVKGMPLGSEAATRILRLLERQLR